MDTSEKMFLLAAEELNFTKAARKAYVTQQCLSDHIKRLETTLGTKLFYRNPKLALTPSGEALYETLQRISSIEENLHTRIQEIEKGQVGTIRLGINATRAKILLPDLMSEYHMKFPQVTLSVILNDTYYLMNDLIHQQLDLVLGVDALPNRFIEAIPAGEESLLVVATNTFLHTYYKGSAPWKDFRPGDEIDLSQFRSFPMVGNKKASTVLQLALSQLQKLHIQPRQFVAISDYNTHIRICGKHMAATFCASFMTSAIQDENRLHPDKEPLLLLPLKRYNHKIRLDILRPKQLFTPKYLAAFITLMQEHIQRIHENTI